MNCNHKNNDGKTQNFIESTKTNLSTPMTRALSLPSVGDSCMYIETRCNNCGQNVFVSFERTDIMQFSNIAFFTIVFQTQVVI